MAHVKRLVSIVADDSRRPLPVWVYVLLLLAGSIALRVAIDPLMEGRMPFITFLPAILVAAVFWGLGAGLSILLISPILADFLFMPPLYSLSLDSQSIAMIVAFMVTGAFLLFVGAELRLIILRLQTLYERENILKDELLHRNKNMLAVVQSLTFHTRRSATRDPDELFKILEGRIIALSSAQDLLVNGNWESCSLADLARQALAPFNGDKRIAIAGPDCLLPANICTQLVLVFHELATNALKYGALSTANGRVDLSWHQMPGASDVAVQWTERGGPPVMKPMQRGFGSDLICAQSGAREVQLDFLPEGVRCSFVVESL